MKPAPKPIHSFKLRPNPRGRLYFLVKVFKNKTEMYAYGKINALAGPPRDYGAACIGYSNWLVHPKKANKPPKLTPQIGEIHFHKNQLTSETISHELTHALFRWMRRKRISVGTEGPSEEHRPTYKSGHDEPVRVCDSEERCCYVLGRMVRRVVNEMYRARLIPG